MSARTPRLTPRALQREGAGGRAPEAPARALQREGTGRAHWHSLAPLRGVGAAAPRATEAARGGAAAAEAAGEAAGEAAAGAAARAVVAIGARAGHPRSE